ncbi:type II secretion system minor pseudopilin GspH [Franconibacter pulveris]|uniref:type II secretion system minor pseudopilin GspH n=1 Tax=Franconibacter pulveris TaxID=435910 RepID=UPI000ADD69F7|nr:type II secretion system minor pseudopilin GspH [Franconibacter pulveris]
MMRARQRGFTLLEVMLAIMIFASSALLVVMTLPERSGPGIFGQQFKTLLEYASTRAVMEGNVIGMVITDREFRLVTLNASETSAEQPAAWKPLDAGRVTTRGEFPEALRVSLAPQRLAESLVSPPQILFLPDGESSVFTLTLSATGDEQSFDVISKGAMPVTLALRNEHGTP